MFEAVSLLSVEGGELREVLRFEDISQGKEVRGLTWSHDSEHLIYSRYPGRGNSQSCGVYRLMAEIRKPSI